jgi:hypothetical protein
MVDDERHWGRRELGLQCGDHRQGSIDLHVPVQRRDARCRRGKLPPRHIRVVHPRRGEVEPDASHAGAMQGIELGLCDVVGDYGDTAPAPAEAMQRIDGAGIIRAVDARVHDHDALEMEIRLQGEQLLERRLAGRVAALGREGELRRRAEDMGVTIAGAARHDEGRRGAPGHRYLLAIG